MLRPISLAAVLLLFGASLVEAQTVRFYTNVGEFDMRLNPTGNANLQAHVDNLLAYVGSGRYHAGVINRAPDDFVLQLGGFTGEGVSIDTIPIGGFDGTDRYNNVTVDADNNGQVDFNIGGLTNTRGTVSLALAAGDANSGGSSFFVNLSDSNTFLDNQNFIPFAVIDNMATIDRILGLNKVDISGQIGQPGSLAYTDVPLTDAGELVTIENVVVVSQSSFSFEGPIRFAAGLPDPISGDNAASSAFDFSSSSSAFETTSMSTSASTSTTPEPGAMLLLAAGGLLAATRRR